VVVRPRLFCGVLAPPSEKKKWIFHCLGFAALREEKISERHASIREHFPRPACGNDKRRNEEERIIETTRFLSPPLVRTLDLARKKRICF